MVIRFCLGSFFFVKIICDYLIDCEFYRLLWKIGKVKFLLSWLFVCLYVGFFWLKKKVLENLKCIICIVFLVDKFIIIDILDIV